MTTSSVSSNTNPWMAYLGMALGAAALLMALFTFWAGPFAPQPNLETSVGELAAGMRQAALDALTGKEPPPPEVRPWDIDRMLSVVTAVLGGLAVILGVFGFVRGEAKRPTVGAAGLGIAAITFQFVAMLAMALLLVLLVSAVLHSLGLDGLAG